MPRRSRVQHDEHRRPEIRRKIAEDAGQRRARERESLIAHCTWCGKVRVGGNWARSDDVPGFLTDLLRERRTHGICPACLDEVQRQAADAPLPAAPALNALLSRCRRASRRTGSAP